MSIKGATENIPSKINAMLHDYADDLEDAWANAGEDPLTISFSAKIGVTKGKNLCEVSISFTKEKVKDSVTFEWNANQGELFKEIFVSPDPDLPDLDVGNKFYNGERKVNA